MGPESRSPLVKISSVRCMYAGVLLLLLLLAGAPKASQGAAFLEEELPLTVTATTPTGLYSNDTNALRFSGVQTITVVFSRAVVALGADFGVEQLPDTLIPFSFGDNTAVVGRFRWVTSNIARWDPVGPWSPDIDTTLVWNTDLATYDGVPLQLDIPGERRIETAPLQVNVLGVGSLGALDRTDGHWDATLGLEDENLPEVPPDGSIVIRFSFPVELPAIQSTVSVVIFEDEKGTTRQDTDIQAIVKQCVTRDTNLYDDDGPVSATCAIIELEGSRLEVGTRYAMIIPEGTKYSPSAGLLKEEVVVEFFGLREFKIPFLWNFKVKVSQDKIRQQDFSGFVNGRNLTLWLPHGLAEGTTAADLKSAISLEWFPWKYMFQKKFPMEFELTLLNKGVASITADFDPAEQYKLYVNARDDIRDGYGLPLQTSEVKFPTSKWAPFFSKMHLTSDLYFEASEAQSWDKIYPIVTRGADKKDVKIFSIAPNNKEEALKIGYQSLKRYGGGYDFENVAPEFQITTPKFKELQTTEIDLASVVQKSPMMGVLTTEYSSDASSIVILDYHIFMSYTMTKDKKRTATLWIVDLVTGKPTEGLDVHAMQWSDNFDDETLLYRGMATTDAMGLVSFSVDNCEEFNCEPYAYWIQQKNGGSLLFGPHRVDPFSSDVGDRTSSISLTLDRAVVLPGDKIRFIGHLVTRDGVEVKPFGQFGEIDKGNMVLEISPPLDPDSDDFSENYPVEIDEYGAFEYVLDIKENAIRQDYRVTMDSNAEGYFYDRFDSVPTRTFVVGEPRIPTALLELITPPWVQPDSKFTIEVLATSLLGATIAEAELTLEYTIELESDDEIQVTETLVTNSTGGASFEIDVTDAGVVIGDTINLSIIWIGPTRERIVEEATLRFQMSDKSVKLERLFQSDVPGLEFGVAATVTQMDVGDLKGLPVQIGLYSLPDNLNVDNQKVTRQLADPSDNSIPIKKISECLVQSGEFSSSLRDCRLSLPGFGQYMVQGCLDDSADGNGVVCGIITLGNTLADWEDDTLRRNFAASLLLAQDVVPFGEPLEFFVDIPLDKFSLIAFWGNELKTNHKVFSFESKGLKSISLDIGDDCIGKCSVSAQVGAARQENSLGLSVPTSIQFDPQGARKFEMSKKNMAYENEDLPFGLNVTVSIDGVEADENSEPVVIAPGETSTVSVAVTKCPGKPTDPNNYACTNPEPATNARVLVVAVDKAYFELSDVPLVDLAEDLRTDLLARQSYDLDYWPDQKYFDTPAVFGEALRRVLELLNANGWTGNDIDTYSGTLQNEINKPLDKILADRSTPVTIGPPGLPGFLSYLGRETQQGSGREDTGPSGRSVASSDPQLRSEANFKAVPLFTVVKTDNDGNAIADFVAPENVGTFVVRAYSSTLDAQHGEGETELIVRLPLSLTSSAPRLVRIGDDFEAGTIITLSGDQKEGVPVTVTLLAHPDQANSIKLISTDDGAEPSVTGQDACPSGDLSCLVTLEEKKIISDIDGQVEVRFRFSAERIGDANITIRADAPGANDALQMSFPVLGQQEAVTLASSFAIEASEDGTPWDEGLDLPAAVPGSGTVNLISGVGNFPTVLSTAESVLAEMPEIPRAHFALANITVPHVLRLYGFGPGDDIHDAAIAGYNEAMYGLSRGNLTTTSYGLVYIPLREMWSEPRVPSLSLNSAGVWVVDQLSEVSEEIEGNKNLWRTKLEDRFVEQAEELREDGFITSIYTVVDVRFALGPVWTPQTCPSSDVCTDAETIKSLSMERISEKIEKEGVLFFSVEKRAKIALTWLKHLGSEEGRNHPDVAAVLDSFRSSIRTIGRTAYISYRPDAAGAAGISSQALALLAFVRAGETGTLLQKIASYVTNQGSGSSVFFYASSTTKIYTMLSLAEYDQSKGSTDPDLSLTVNSGSTVLLEGEFRDPSDPVLTSTTSYEDLDDRSAPLIFTAQGRGEVSVAATLEFIPAELLPFPTYKGIFVETCIQKAGASGEGSGSCLKSAPLGWQLAITIQITTPDDLDAVTVRALMPGGIEPVDPLIAGDASAQTTCQLDSLSIRYRYWYWPLCPQQETKPSVVTFTYNRLRSGTSTITFQAISASVGTWVLPPVRAFVDQQPEVMGLSIAGEFKICENCEAEAIEPASPPQPCPNDCSGSGICDLTKGVCECDVGFTKADCSELVTT